MRGRSNLVRVSEGSSYRESTVVSVSVYCQSANRFVCLVVCVPERHSENLHGWLREEIPGTVLQETSINELVVIMIDGDDDDFGFSFCIFCGEV